jgi:hypothetical protein
MSKSLQEAIERLRDLPEEGQDAIAAVVFAFISSDQRHFHLRPKRAKQTLPTRASFRRR